MSLLHHQIAYYRARATEYDEWFYRQGRYDRGPEVRTNRHHIDPASQRRTRVRDLQGLL